MSASITLKAGATWDLVMTLTDADGVAIDLTGAAARLQARVDADSAAVLTLDSADDTLAIDEAEGAITWAIAAETSAAVPAGRYLADLRITYADARVDISEDLILRILPAYTEPAEEPEA